MSRERQDVLKALREARPASLDPASCSGTARQEHDLVRILAGEDEYLDNRPVPATRPRAWRWALPVTAAAAVAALAGSLVAVSSGGAESPPVAAQAGAKLTLLDAADKLAAPGPVGTYWRWSTEQRTVHVVRANGEEFAVVDTAQQEHSVGVEPGTKSLLVMNLNASTRPRTADDEAAWQQAGQPADVEPLTVPGSPRSKRSMLPGKPHASVTNLESEIYALGDENVSYADLRALPGDADALRAELFERYLRVDGDEVHAETELLFTQAASLITMPVEHAVRAAAYRILAGLPGIRSLGQVQDPLGRTGVGVAMRMSTRGTHGLVERQLIVDGSTGLLLAEQELLVRPTPEQLAVGIDAGTVVRSTSTLRAEWTDEELKAPAGATR